MLTGTATTKLWDQLWNENSQNHKYYQQSPLCPACQLAEETTNHIFWCPESTCQCRVVALSILKHTLADRLPLAFLATILIGITQPSDCSELGLGPHKQSFSNNMTLQAAAPQSELSWSSFLRGHISVLWQEEFKAASAPPKKRTTTTLKVKTWSAMSFLIRQVLIYSKTLWDHRCAIVHGRTEDFKTSKEMTVMKNRVWEAYINFAKDQHCVPSSRAYLFNWPLGATLTLERESMASVSSGGHPHSRAKGNHSLRVYEKIPS